MTFLEAIKEMKKGHVVKRKKGLGEYELRMEDINKTYNRNMPNQEWRILRRTGKAKSFILACTLDTADVMANDWKIAGTAEPKALKTKTIIYI